MTYLTRQNNATMNAMAAANCVNGHVRPESGLGLNSFDTIKDFGPERLRRVLIRI